MAKKLSCVSNEIPGERTLVNGQEPHKRKPRERFKTAYGKVRLGCINDLDGRTSAAKHARALVASLVSDLGGERNITEAQRQLIQRAAVIGAFIEDSEARWIAGADIAVVEYFMACNTQKRMLCALGLERRVRTVGIDVNALATNIMKKSRADKRAARLAAGATL